ncbi:hypothetical protein CCR75_007319 [Bremia lactucae]|uniref:Uncharacterized protein n=1 Tax=Bremia lactucae TaxID=4779 RepID=A0A976FIJ0_BRELC|nr:hypothetical protein CCR75_007319 [Bremia lactucae]
MNRPHASRFRSSLFALILLLLMDEAQSETFSTFTFANTTVEASTATDVAVVSGANTTAEGIALPPAVNASTAALPAAFEETTGILNLSEDSTIVSIDPTTEVETPTIIPAAMEPRESVPVALDVLEPLTAAPEAMEPPTAPPLVETVPPTIAIVATEPPTTAPVATEPPPIAPVATEAPPIAPVATAPPVVTEIPAAPPFETILASPAAPVDVGVPETRPLPFVVPHPDLLTSITPAPASLPPDRPASQPFVLFQQPPLTPDVAIESSTTASPLLESNTQAEKNRSFKNIESDLSNSSDSENEGQPFDGSEDGSDSDVPDESQVVEEKKDEKGSSSNEEELEFSSNDSGGDMSHFTLTPITADDVATEADRDSSDPTDNSESESVHASTLSGKRNSFGGWKLALVVVAAVCVVLISVYFGHKRYVRNAMANKRDRGSSEQRALDSFFRQNRVTVARDTGVSSNHSVPDPPTPRSQIVVTMPFNTSHTSDYMVDSSSHVSNRRSRQSIYESTSAPTKTTLNNEYKSYARSSSPFRLDSSYVYASKPLYSDVGEESILLTDKTKSLLQCPSRDETVAHMHERASVASSIEEPRDPYRFSSQFSVFDSSSAMSVDSDTYRLSTPVPDAPRATSLPKSESNHSYPSNGRMSDTRSQISFDERFPSERSRTDSLGTDLSVTDSFVTIDSFLSVNSYASETIQDTDDGRDSDSFVRRENEF